MRPRILVLLGDSAGVGPELCAKLAGDIPREARNMQIVLTGDTRVFSEAQQCTGVKVNVPACATFEAVENAEESLVFWNLAPQDTHTIPRGEVSAAAGKEVLNALLTSIDLAKKDRIDGMVFAPFNKESMHRAGAKHTSELELFKDEFNRPDIAGEFNILDGLWLARVTSHIAVAEIAKNLDVRKIAHTIEILAEVQEQAGRSPRIAVAALNPHGGEHGMFGDEEARLITPAMEVVRKAHPAWVLEGPIPPDTLFPRAMKGGFTGIVGMYHDQLQIASKLMGLERGVSFHPGMKIPIATAAHGTAFDIQGTGTANHQALRNALTLVAGMLKGGKGNPAPKSAGHVIGVKGVEHTGIIVKNSLKLAQWYRETFGAVELSRSQDDQPVIFLGFEGGSLLELVPGDDTASLPTDHVHLSFAVESIDAAIDGLMKSGAERRGEKFTAYEGSPVAFFRDPEGNLIQLVQRLSGLPQPS